MKNNNKLFKHFILQTEELADTVIRDMLQIIKSFENSMIEEYLLKKVSKDLEEIEDGFLAVAEELPKKTSNFNYDDINRIKKKIKIGKSMLNSYLENINDKKNKCDAPGCMVERRTDKIVDGEGNKYHSYTCAERNSKSMLCCLTCHKMIPVSRHVYELTKDGIAEGIYCPHTDCEKKREEKIKKEKGKEYIPPTCIDVNNAGQTRVRRYADEPKY